jgi:hypothetical protein
MDLAAPRTTKFLVELIGDLEIVGDICSRCPEGISLEENFAGWGPNPKPLIQVFLVAHPDMPAEAAGLLLALVLEGIFDRPGRSNIRMQMRVTVGSDVELSLIEDRFRLVADCSWAEIQYASAPDTVIPVRTTNISALLKQALAASR